MCLIQDISSHVFLLAFLICRSIGAGLGSEPRTSCMRDQQKGRASQLTVILPRCFALVFSYEIYRHEAFFFSFCAFVTSMVSSVATQHVSSDVSQYCCPAPFAGVRECEERSLLHTALCLTAFARAFLHL